MWLIYWAALVDCAGHHHFRECCVFLAVNQAPGESSGRSTLDKVSASGLSQITGENQLVSGNEGFRLHILSESVGRKQAFVFTFSPRNAEFRASCWER